MKLLGGVEVFRSLEDRKKGPKFYLHAKRTPLEAEVSVTSISLFFPLFCFSPPMLDFFSPRVGTSNIFCWSHIGVMLVSCSRCWTTLFERAFSLRIQLPIIIIITGDRITFVCQIFIQGAAVIFGFETGITFKLTNERIEAELALNLFNVFKAKIWIAAGYGNPFADTGFQAKFIIETGFDELSNKTAQLLISGLQAARKALEKARGTVKEAKVACERNADNFCNICEKLACDQISEECKRAMDDFKHFIGEKVDKFGECDG